MRDTNSSIMRMLREWIRYLFLLLLLFATILSAECIIDFGAHDATEEIGIFLREKFFYRLAAFVHQI